MSQQEELKQLIFLEKKVDSIQQMLNQITEILIKRNASDPNCVSCGITITPKMFRLQLDDQLYCKPCAINLLSVQHKPKEKEPESGKQSKQKA